MFTPADTISIPTSRLKENIPDIAAITGNTLWGFSLLLSKTALNYAPTSILLSMRFIIAFLLMNLILLFKIERISLKGKNILPVLLLALNDAAYFYCESYGIALTNSMFTGVVLSLIPILAMGLSALFLKEFPTLRQILFSFLPVAGVVIIILAGSSSGAIQTSTRKPTRRQWMTFSCWPKTPVPFMEPKPNIWWHYNGTMPVIMPLQKRKSLISSTRAHRMPTGWHAVSSFCLMYM